jgi:hypothetical protein
VSLPATGGWQTWADVTTTVTLPAGLQVLTLAQDTGGWNLNYVRLAAAGSPEAPYGGTPAPVPGTVQAENYDTGGSGVAYTVTSVNGNGTAYRADGVDLETSSEGGYNLGWTSGGQWFRYTVNVATAGSYTATFRVAAPGAVANAFHFAGASVSLPATGGWQTWADVTATVTLPAGQQVLTLAQDTGGWNLNYVRLAAAGGGPAITVSPTSPAFPATAVGATSAGQPVTVHNGGTAAGAVTVGVTGDYAQTNTCGTSLAAGASCTVTVTFHPTATGTRTGTLTVSGQTVGLSGTGTGGATNLAAGKPTGESSHNDVYASGNLTDADPGTYWESANNAFPQWAQVDLGTAQAASRAVLRLPAAWGVRTETLTLSVSTDGATFTTVTGPTGYTFDPAAANTVTITFGAVTARYWRITVAANTGWPAAQCSDFQIWTT